MRTQTYYEKLKALLRGRLRDALGAEVQLGWKMMGEQTLAVLRLRKDGGLMLEINLRAAGSVGSADTLCSRVIPRVAGVQSVMTRMPESYLQGLAWLEDMYCIKRNGVVIISALPSRKYFRPGKKRMFTAADLYSATCVGELTVLGRIPEICYRGKNIAESSLLCALDQVRWLLENGHLPPLVQFAAAEGALCSLAALWHRCEEYADPFWSGVLFRLMAVSNCRISEKNSQMVQLLQQQSDSWRLAAVDLWKTAQQDEHPVVSDTMEAVRNVLIKLDKTSWSSPADCNGGSLHFLL